MLTKQLRIALLTFALAFSACSRSTPTDAQRADTGAARRAKEFFTAVVRQDWPGAYELLEPKSQEWCNKVDFADRAKKYFGKIGFTPTNVAVSVSELGDDATAIATYRDPSALRFDARPTQ